MKLTKKFLTQESVYKEVLEAIGHCHSSLFLTMDVDDEVISPLPKEYHKLISKISLKGVQVTRVGFGRPESFSKIQELYKGYFKNIVFIYGGIEGYKRTILIDHQVVFYKKGSCFYYSLNKSKLENTLNYFKNFML